MENTSVFLSCNKNGGPARYKGGFNMASYTQNYQLHQWEPSDDFLRTDFNEDFKKIDTAIKTTEQSLRTNFTGEISRLDAALSSTEEDLRADFTGNLDSVNTALSQLENELRSELTSDVSRLDTLIDTLEKRINITIGSYTGNGAFEQQITLGFQPKAVLIEHKDGRRSEGNNYYFWGGLAHQANNSVIATLTTTGFTVSVSGQSTATNIQNTVYVYVAFR